MEKDFISPIAGLILLFFSLYMFYNGIVLMSVGDVATSLLSILVGFVTLSGGVTLIRTWSLTRIYRKPEEKKEEKVQ